MDFSSTERTLSSLLRRTPKLGPNVLSLAIKLQTIQDDPFDPNFVKYTADLLQIGTVGEKSDNGIEMSEKTQARWEPLAVGFQLTSTFLQRIIAFYQQKEESNNDEVYMDGPRVPTIQSLSSNKSNNDTKNQISQAKVDDVTTLLGENELVSFSEIVMKMCQMHLEHNEPRVRSLVAKVVGYHTKLGTTLICSTADSTATNGSSENHTKMGQTIIDQSIGLYETTLKSLKDHLSSGPETENKSKASSGALDDTTGWRALETNLFCIGSFVHSAGDLYFKLIGGREGCGATSDGAMDDSLLKDIEHCCVTHINRHVRAAGIALLEQLIHACASSFTKQQQDNLPQGLDDNGSKNNVMDLLLLPESNLRQTIVRVLKVALADNWSQVRMAASVLCRVFYVTFLDYAEEFYHHANVAANNNDDKIDVQSWLLSTYPMLLPRMCLNRFYLAQGVKLYSHDTWRILFERSEKIGGTGGVESVALNAGPICRYYVQMCDADNHVVREAGCQAVAELATKLGRNIEYAEYLSPYVVMLLQALIMCFHDESWPVRDEACLACGTFCLAYPEECKPELPMLFSRWTEQLTDQIWSVREDAAVALGDAIEAYGASMYDQVMEVLKRDLPSARNQPAMSREEYVRLQNDIKSHTNSQLYSCGSLAPKLRKGGAGRIGCGDCQITRPKAPWEATDGCIYLIRELCVRLCVNGPGTVLEGVALTDDTLLPIMTELADICQVKHFPQSDDLRTTLWKQLPLIAKALGKQRFKRIYLQLFMELLGSNMENRSYASQLSVHAAGQCAEELATFVGAGIFRGRFEEEWQRELFDRTMAERRQAAIKAGPGPEAFSPFGPSGLFISRNESKTDESLVGQDTAWSPSVIKKEYVPGSGMFESL